MSDDLADLTDHFKMKLESAGDNWRAPLNILAHLSSYQAEYAKNPEDYDLNRSIGMFLADGTYEEAHAEPFLIKAVNENRDDEHRLTLLRAMAKVFESVGDIERECLILQAACQHSHVPMDLKNLALSLLRLGKEEEASTIAGEVLSYFENLSGEKARELGTQATQLIWYNEVICSRFGELAHFMDIYIKMRKLGLTPKVQAILTAKPEWISNRVLLEYWREQHSNEITILTDPHEVTRAEEAYDGCHLHTDFIRLPDNRVLHINWASIAVWRLWEDSGGGPLLKLRDDHREIGYDWLHRRGMPGNAWFVALHVREAGYHREKEKGWVGNIHRNSQIEDYFPAVEAITQRGGWVVRIGDQSMTPLPPMGQVIDYALATERAEELDIFFCAAAKFMLASSSGPLPVANVFGTPLLAANLIPPGDNPYSSKDVFIHKNLRRRATGEYLNAQEIVTPPLRIMQSPRGFSDRDLEVIDNTPDEIRDAAEEMMMRLEGTFHMTNQDKADLNLYREMNDYPGISSQSTVATSFLRRHRFLVE